MNTNDTPMHYQALNSMRERVEHALVANGFDKSYCESQHQRCGYFLDSVADVLADAESGPIHERMEFVKSSLADDIRICRAFRKLWDACQMIETFVTGEMGPQDSPFASNLWGDSRI